MSVAAPELSVVMAAFNRPQLLARLLRQLDAQTLPPERYEVVVVDDGSAEPIAPVAEALGVRYALRVVRQENAGAAAARHRGVLEARGGVLVITDDDMAVGPDFLERHLERHPPGSRNVVLGWIRPDADMTGRPLFERWYAHLNDRMAEELGAGGVRPHGGHLFTGNVSLRRADYLAVGGFDAALKRSEDKELGYRLEKAGCTFVYSREAYVLHGSDHVSYERWMRVAHAYGVFDTRISRKHPDVGDANPWRFLFTMNPLARPLLAGAFLAPRASQPLSWLALALTRAADAAGLEKAALAGSSVVYAMQYHRGLRAEAGGLKGAARDIRRYLAVKDAPPAAAPAEDTATRRAC